MVLISIRVTYGKLFRRTTTSRSVSPTISVFLDDVFIGRTPKGTDPFFRIDKTFEVETDFGDHIARAQVITDGSNACGGGFLEVIFEGEVIAFVPKDSLKNLNPCGNTTAIRSFILPPSPKPDPSITVTFNPCIADCFSGEVNLSRDFELTRLDKSQPFLIDWGIVIDPRTPECRDLIARESSRVGGMSVVDLDTEKEIFKIPIASSGRLSLSSITDLVKFIKNSERIKIIVSSTTCHHGSTPSITYIRISKVDWHEFVLNRIN